MSLCPLFLPQKKKEQNKTESIFVLDLCGHSFVSINVPCFLSAYLLSTAFKNYKIVLLDDHLFSLLFSKEIILQSLAIFTFSYNYPNDQY